MIKKVIFDLDDTLIINKIDVMNNYDYILKKYNMNTTINELYDVIGSYEVSTNKYDRYELLDLINNYYKSNYSIELVDDIIDAVGEWTYEAPKEVVDTLEYLSNKYELYVLTNWFHKSQEQRLKTAGILKYFKDIRSAEIVTKPNEEAFKQFFNDCTPGECVMVGDSIKMDIEVPNKLGMKTILCDFKNKGLKTDGKIITSFNELVDML
jgi:FMN phosphatase YigB (HAD superfamily)